MKKIKINELSLPSFGGECIGYVISKYNGKGMLFKPVYKRRIKKTPRQLEMQERFTKATQYAKYVLRDLEKREAYERKLKKINGSLFPAIVADYLKNGDRSIVQEQVQDLPRPSFSRCRGKRLAVNSKPSQSSSFRDKGRGSTKSKQ